MSPPPDGGYPGANTAEGTNALYSRTSGLYNTAVGANALFSDTTGSRNTANGVNALRFNATGINNTAIGTNALYRNTSNYNTALGDSALLSNTTGPSNTATGVDALLSNTTGIGNTANGRAALFSNTTGDYNTANSNAALEENTTGSYNTANGAAALANNTTGSRNTALGLGAGAGVTTANNVIVIGANVEGQNVSDSCYIGNVFGKLSPLGTSVVVNSAGKLGTLTSSRRFKDEIKPMDEASEAVLVLKPVTFRYKKEIDPKGIPQWGLVAEEVAKVNPDLVVLDAEGKINTVRYEAVNAMLLNEFLKEHRTVEDLQANAVTQSVRTDAQEATLTKQQALIAQQQKQIEALTVDLQKINDQVARKKSSARRIAKD